MKAGQLLRLEGRAAEVGAIGGLVAGLAMGVVFQFGTDVLLVLGSYLGESSLLRGWIVHLFIAVVYGVVFSLIVTYPPIGDFLEVGDVVDQALVGMVYSIFIVAASVAALAVVFQLPWNTAATQAPTAPIPGPTQGGLFPAMLFALAHLVYGAVLGTVYAIVYEPEDSE